MPRYHTILLIALILTSCNQPGKKSIKPPAESLIATPEHTKPGYNNRLFKQYISFLNKLDTNKMENSVLAATEYAALFKGKDQNICDSAFMLFNEFYGRLSGGLEDLPSRDTSIKYDSLLTDSNRKYQSELSGNLELYAQKLTTNGFKVYMSEGDDYIGQDLDFVAKWFYGYVSPSMRTYLTQLNKDDKEGFSEDAGLTISPIQLADRTVWWEIFATNHPNTLITEQAQSCWKNYLGSMLEGMDNSPVLDLDKNAVNEYYKTAYSYLQNKYPATQTNKFIIPYYKLLLNKETKRADKLLKKYRQEKIIE